MPAARVVSVDPQLAQVLTEGADGAWRVLLATRGPDAEAEAQAIRDRLEADELRPGAPPPAGVRGPGWLVRLPVELRTPFEALAAANGTTPEEQLARYLSADLGLVHLAADAARRAS